MEPPINKYKSHIFTLNRENDKSIKYLTPLK